LGDEHAAEVQRVSGQHDQYVSILIFTAGRSHYGVVVAVGYNDFVQAQR
jgi:hypothetical protein